jgi:hypothetical protein
MSSLGVVLYGEGQEGSAGRGAKFKDRLIVVRIEAPTLSRCESRIFDPEFEFAVSADRGNEVGVNSWREPLDLIE